ncbi:urease accessory protein UreD [Kitasatospora sp. NPDC052896]|uniref:urease accessory protein UreD n=1 Tax=Kitasatospora sp. NPDC052896 TaxID=3364061 RepID=UPI0037C50A79
MAGALRRDVEVVPPPDPGLTAQARIVARRDGHGATVLPVLAGRGALAVRRLRGGPRAEVALVGAMAAPLGGDRLAVAVRVEPGARLRVTSVAATVSLPGAGPEPAHYDVDLRVGEGAELDWLPEPVVAAAGSRLLLRTRITLAAGARLRFREEQVLGRQHDWAVHGAPGRLTSRLTVCQDGLTVLDQQTDLGPGASGWDGPAVLGGRHALGQLLSVGLPPAPAEQRAAPAAGECALLDLPGHAARQLVALAPDALALRAMLGPA